MKISAIVILSFILNLFSLTTPWAASEPKLFSFVDLVRHEKAAVVNIRASQQVTGRKSLFGENHPFGDLFGDIVPKEFRDQSLGTGFIIKKDGLLLTNNHLVEKADKIIVRLADEREFEARVIGSDPQTDIALLRIKGGGDFPVVRFGDSERLEVGEWVIAIGNPFGLEQTVTAGIISAKGRAIGSGPYDDYLQTDASINPGNSGGPLFNVKGEVVGINTAIQPEGNGIGFAIPIHQVIKILPQLEREGKVTRGWLGVMIQELTRDLAKAFGLRGDNGALISDVFEDSPAARAGIQRGDVIVEFDGKKVTRMRNLPALVAETPVGKTVKVKTVRKGREKFFEVEIGRLEDEPGEK